MLYHYPFPSRLKWVATAFKKGYQFVDEGGQYMGKMQFSAFGNKISSELNGFVANFTLSGVFLRKITILDENSEILGSIQIKILGNPVIRLANGEVYIWKRKNLFSTHWQIIHDLPGTDDDPISIDYKYLYRFMKESGGIELYEENDHNELLTLIGFFIGVYFIRQRRKQG